MVCSLRTVVNSEPDSMHYRIAVRHDNGSSPKALINLDLFTPLAGFWGDSMVDNIVEEYDHRLMQHLHQWNHKNNKQLSPHIRARKTL
ncbi:hypothetical protein ANCDUO_03070 [Ancylostoma duodenale]|uniref:Uncharacterized protein n=1 Tax=Ancylostoma duodenale TaxID=51022 RepID=A0A0C2HAS3_9BILA|nr:hypothetical protein ANCDUO_03070 [Ancylostoma duodenale]